MSDTVSDILGLIERLGDEAYGAEDERAAKRGVDGLHERIGQKYLCRWFGPDVAAKRYLCATEPAYRAALSLPSERSLMLQGGPLTPDEVSDFLASPCAEAAVALHRWDNEAKVPGLPLTPLTQFAPFIRTALA